MERPTPQHPTPTEPEQTDPAHDLDTTARPVGHVALRRAVMRILVLAGEPVRVRDMVTHLESIDGVRFTDAHVSSASQRVASILRWQMTHGRVRRLGWGRYEFVSGSLAKTSLWRVMNWERMGDDGRLARPRTARSG